MMAATPTEAPRRPAWARAAIAPFSLLAGTWFVLTGGAPGGALFGAAAAGVGAALSVRTRPQGTPALRLASLPRFLARILGRGFLGGLDVARRALSMPMPLAPGWVRLPVRSGVDDLGVAFGGALSVLPGTLAAGPGDGWLDVHALDADALDLEDLWALQDETRRLFGAPKPGSGFGGQR